MSTILQCLKEGQRSLPNEILLEDGASLSFDRSQTLRFARSLVKVLGEQGIRREDRVAIVLPDGARLCLAFLSVSCHGIAAPLNPAASLQNLLSWLEELQPRAILVGEGTPDAAHEAASRLGLTVIDLESGASRNGMPDSDKSERLNQNIATRWRR